MLNCTYAKCRHVAIRYMIGCHMPNVLREWKLLPELQSAYRAVIQTRQDQGRNERQ